MLFLIEYDRPRGLLLQLCKFDDASRRVAEEERIKLELDLNRKGVEHEVVLLEAPSEEALRHTHGRYFESVAGLIVSSPQVQALLVETAISPHEPEK